MTEMIKDLKISLPPDAGFRPGVDVGGAAYIPEDKSGPEIVRPIGPGRSLTPWELHIILAQKASDSDVSA